MLETQGRIVRKAGKKNRGNQLVSQKQNLGNSKSTSQLSEHHMAARRALDKSLSFPGAASHSVR